MMRISKVVPAHRVILRAGWIKKDFCIMDDRLRELWRKKSCVCFWCKKAFQNGDTIALVGGIPKSLNRRFCQSCVEKFEMEEQP